MSTQKYISEILQRRAREAAEIAACLLEHPDCMNGEHQKENAYQVAIEYFIQKQKNTQWPGSVSYNQRGTIALRVLIDSYDEAQDKEKKKYAKKIAFNLLNSHDYYLMRIPDETKERAFQIVINFLEELRCL